MNLGDVPTWVAAIGTVGALFTALFQISTDRNRRRAERRIEQARLVSAFLGSEETRGRPRLENVGQTSPKPSEGGRTPIYLVNGSGEPVYQPVVGIVSLQGAAPKTMEALLDNRTQSMQQTPGYQPIPVTTVSILPPGKYVVWIKGIGWSGYMSGRSSAEIAFTDRAGVHWIRRSNGEIAELPVNPLEYFQSHGLIAPFELQTPEPPS